jgi:hypothetical protein
VAIPREFAPLGGWVEAEAKWHGNLSRASGAAGIQTLLSRAAEIDLPIVYVNDNHSFVIKARHSIYGTPLEYLLDQMSVDRLVLCGQVTEQCIFYSALDAHVRHFKVAAPTDGVAAIYEHLAEAALEMMERNLSAEVCRASECPLQEGDE